MYDMQLFENFLPNISEVREHALRSEFIDWEGPDGQVYKRICISEVPGLHKAIERVVGPIEMLGMGYRLNYAGELPNQSIHCDLGWGTHALVLYLRNGESGTGFWRHNATGSIRLREGDNKVFEAVKDDWEYSDRWSLYNFVGMRENRAIIYSSELFHSRWPFEGFGTTPEDGRLIAVAFFSLKGKDMIRQATFDDLPRIMQMGEKFHATTHYKEHSPFNFNSVAYLSKVLIETGIVLVAELDGLVVGVVGLVLAPHIFNTDSIGAHEVMWWVEPEYQDSGIGRALVEGVEVVCRNREVTFIQMALLPNSPPKAEALYGALGYRHSETLYTKVL